MREQLANREASKRGTISHWAKVKFSELHSGKKKKKRIKVKDRASKSTARF